MLMGVHVMDEGSLVAAGEGGEIRSWGRGRMDLLFDLLIADLFFFHVSSVCVLPSTPSLEC